MTRLLLATAFLATTTLAGCTHELPTSTKKADLDWITKAGLDATKKADLDATKTADPAELFGTHSEHSAVFKALVDSVETVHTALAPVKDKATSDVAMAVVRKEAAKLRELAKKARTMPAPTKEEAKRINNRHGSAADMALKRLDGQTLRTVTEGGTAELSAAILDYRVALGLAAQVLVVEWGIDE